IIDADGRPALAHGASPSSVADPVLAGMLRRLAESRPRRWDQWIRRQDRSIHAEVRDQLTAAGVIHAEQRRMLVFSRPDRITVRDPLLVNRMRWSMTETLRPGRPLT